MQKNSTIVHDLTPDQITSLFEGLQKQLTDLKQNFEPKVPSEYLTRNEIADMLKVDLSTIHNWCKKGKLKPLGLGNRVYFLRTDIETAMIPLGVGKSA